MMIHAALIIYATLGIAAHYPDPVNVHHHHHVHCPAIVAHNNATPPLQEIYNQHLVKGLEYHQPAQQAYHIHSQLADHIQHNLVPRPNKFLICTVGDHCLELAPRLIPKMSEPQNLEQILQDFLKEKLGSFIEHINARQAEHTKAFDRALEDTLTPLVERQSEIERKTDARLDRIQKIIGDLTHHMLGASSTSQIPSMLDSDTKDTLETIDEAPPNSNNRSPDKSPNIEDLKDKINDIDMQIETLTSYHRHLLNNREKGLFGVRSMDALPHHHLQPLPCHGHNCAEEAAISIPTNHLLQLPQLNQSLHNGALHVDDHHPQLQWPNPGGSPASVLPQVDGPLATLDDHSDNEDLAPAHNTSALYAPRNLAPHLAAIDTSEDNIDVSSEHLTNVLNQYDGNDTLNSDQFPSISNRRIMFENQNPAQLDPAILTCGSTRPTTPSPSNNHQSLVFNYSLNPHNQLNRLTANAQKLPITVNLNSFQVIQGENHPTNASLEFNPGTYLTVIKPALGAIFKGWETSIAGVTINCDDISDRLDITGNSVGSKLNLLLKPENDPNHYKAVLHFYHTATKVQVQGSSIMPEGISSPAWLVKYFIEPLVNSQIAASAETIDNINDAISAGEAFKCNICGTCNKRIDPNASLVKEQGLTCKKCAKVFHKRCTDRRLTRSNWQRSPWFCQTCVLGQTQAAEQSPGIHALGPQQSTPTPEHNNLATADMDIIEIEDNNQPESCNQPHTDIRLNPYSKEFLPQPSQSKQTLPTDRPQPPTLKYPSAGVKQRSSNVKVTAPEKEFLQTALDSCRSTIIQQEADIKRLKECMDLRNKKIMQLEGQVNFASDCLASTDKSNAPTSNKPTAYQTSCDCQESLKLIHSKLDSLSTLPKAPVNNIHINNSHSYPKICPENQTSQSTQTDQFYIACKTCEKTPIPDVTLEKHIVQFHEEMDTSRTVLYNCHACGESFGSNTSLQTHMITEHGASPPNHPHVCSMCTSTFTSRDTLLKHIGDTHEKNCFQCDLCNNTSSPNDCLHTHTKSNHEKQDFHCNTCDSVFTSNEQLQEHIGTNHGKTTQESTSQTKSQDL